jgi:hypothetical protein
LKKNPEIRGVANRLRTGGVETGRVDIAKAGAPRANQFLRAETALHVQRGAAAEYGCAPLCFLSEASPHNTQKATTPLQFHLQAKQRFKTTTLIGDRSRASLSTSFLFPYSS